MVKISNWVQTLQKLSGLVSFSCMRASMRLLLFQTPEAELTVLSSRVRELSRLMLLWSPLSLLLLVDL